MSENKNISSALRTLDIEKSGLEALVSALDGDLGESFNQACELIHSIKGKVIITGMGKSGHVGSKIAATLASTGTPSFFVHPAEANHGDLGMISTDDVVIALSWSGETAELEGILAYTSRYSIPLIAITKERKSTLGREATVCLQLPKTKEACPNGLAPTTSSMMQMAISDALAVALLEGKGFSADDFGVYHPGGSLGASLNRIGEVMHDGDSLPLVKEHTNMIDAVMELSEKRFGCVGITDDTGKLVGIITDGDLARNLDKNMQSMSVDEIMIREPKTISADALVTTAMKMLNDHNISALLVTDENNVPIGIIHMLDLLRLGVV